MSDETTPRLTLPLLHAGQAQKEMSHNEALARLDLVTQAAVLDVDLNTPPDEPAAGDAWIVGDDPNGAWTGRPGAIAGWTGGGWRFADPWEGMRAWVAARGACALFSDGGWTVGALHGRLLVEGVQVIGPRAAPIADPVGGATVDGEARATLAALLEALREHGLIDPG